MTATTPRQACPVCDSELTAGADHCPKCKTDLRLLSPAAEIALDFYNEGLDLARTGDRQGAVEKMQAALAADPELVDAYIVQGKLVAQAGAKTDLEQALQVWQRARAASPTDEQARKLDICTQTAQAKLDEIAWGETAKRRQSFLSVVAGGLCLAALGGVVGYLLQPGRPLGSVISGLVPRAAAHSTAQPVTSPVVKVNAEKPVDPIEAIVDALKRPDITVKRSDDGVSLEGRVQTGAEKSLVLSAAAYASHLSPDKIDGSNLKVKPVYSPVPAPRVERMLRMVVGGIDRSSTDPLHEASLSVAGGANKDPLKITGSCASPAAAGEIVRLVKEVYPSANPVDTSKLVVRATTLPAVRPPLHVAPFVPRVVVQSDAPRVIVKPVAPRVAAKSLTPPRPRIASAAQTTADTSPGDQVYINLSSKTYTVQPGDTIMAIAQKYGHDKRDWQQLWRNNRGAVRRPNAIPAGTVLKLPPGWEPPKKALDENE